MFAVVGPVLVVRGIQSMRGDSRFQQRALRAQGVVTQIRWDHRGEDSRSYPVRPLQPPRRAHRRGLGDPGLRPRRGSEGDSVNVLYDPQNPTDIRIDGFFGSGKMGGAVMIVMGVVFFFMGVFIGSIFALVG